MVACSNSVITMMQYSTMGKELAGVAIASDSFDNGKMIYKRGGLLTVWYDRPKKSGKSDDGISTECSRILGTVRDCGTNHIVEINNTNNMHCTSETCNDAGMPCRHAVALIMHVAQDDAFEPMPDIIHDKIPTYMKGYTKDDELADEQMDKKGFEFLFTEEEEKESEPFDLDEVKKRQFRQRKSDFDLLLRNGSGAIGDLKRSISMNTKPNTQLFMRIARITKGIGAAQFAAEFDVDMACLQKGALIHADSALKRKNHILFLVMTWKDADRRCIKCGCMQALVELATYDREWKNDVKKTLEKIISELTNNTAEADATGTTDEMVGMYGSDVAWMCKDILRVGRGKVMHARGK